jgi:malate synthase
MSVEGVEVAGPVTGRFSEVLTPEALAFVAALHRELDPVRRDLLRRRAEIQERLDAGEQPDFQPGTRPVREDGAWRVPPVPADLQDRRVEITGPAEKKMIINALNSGARVFMADFEDANTPSWHNMVQGQVDLIDAVRRSIDFTSPEGKEYRLQDKVATLLVRPRGWHLEERHLLVDGNPVSASLFDFGLYFFHNARELLESERAPARGPYYYLAKLESHLEARLWNDAFNLAQDALGIPRGTIKATVLIETILAAFEMEEILHELKDHSSGLNAGRWDYLFSIIKKFRRQPDIVFPDRIEVTMTQPFYRAYTELLVKTCHRRDAQAIGGMSAFIPNRKDPEVTERALAKVREDKVRESNDGFDGTWVAHPDLVPVATEEFDRVLGNAPHQVDRRRDEVDVSADDLLNFKVPGEITEGGVRTNISVGILYIESWLRGVGAAALFNLMEDTATSEISRCQVWQWAHHAAAITGGPKITPELVQKMEDEELDKIFRAVGAEAFSGGRFEEARALFERVALSDDFVDFLTIPGYEYID